MFSTGTYDAEYVTERQQIREMVEFERYCRDYGLWDEMKNTYCEDTTVKISWYEGAGYEFVEQSKKMQGSKHKIFNTIVEICRKKAVAEVIAQIKTRAEIQGVTADLVSDVRLVYRLKKSENGWKIYSIECIYEKDALHPLWGVERMPKMERMEGLRESYMFLGMILSAKGRKVSTELPGEDRPDTVAGLYEKYRIWLET